MRWLIALVFTCFALSGMPAMAETTVPKSLGQMQLSFAPVVKTTAPAVVNVYSKTLAAQDSQQGLFNDPFFRQFFGERGNFSRPREQAENSLGSGVIVDSSWIDRHQQPRDPRRHGHPRGSGRQARIRGKTAAGG